MIDLNNFQSINLSQFFDFGIQWSALYCGGKPGTKTPYHRQLASRDTSFIPTSFKSPQSLRPIRARDTAYLKSYATDVLITPCLSPCFVEGSNGSKAKIVWHLSMLLEILVMNIVVLSFIFPKCFLSKLFFKIFFPTFFSQILA